MAKRQNFVVGSTNPVTATKTQAQLNNGWNKYEVLKAGDLDGVFNAVSDYSNDSSQEIWNAIRILKGSNPTGASTSELGNSISTVLGAKATKATDFITPLTSNNKGATAADLNTLREEIETSSLTFKGYVATSAPSSSTYGLVEGNIWINASAMPTTFPVSASYIRVWNGTSWTTTSDTYTVKDFDFFRNINDGEGYYWFGGQWVVMSTDMSTTYFTLNQTSGKWEIKSSVNLPGNPTTTTPTSSSPDNQIATKKYVDEAIAPLPTTTYFPDVFDQKWSDYILSNPRWLRADDFAWHNSSEGPVAYQHLENDLSLKIALYANNTYYYHREENSDVIGAVAPYAWRDIQNRIVFSKSKCPSVGDVLYSNSDAQQTYTTVREIFGDIQETVAGITVQVYLTDDGHKICPASEESNVLAIYNATGVAWYYILDTANQRFKLPRSKHNKYAASLSVIGNGNPLRFTDTDGGNNTGSTYYSNTLTLTVNPATDTGQISNEFVGVVKEGQGDSGIIAQQEQDTDQYKYLYFYNGSNT